MAMARPHPRLPTWAVLLLALAFSPVSGSSDLRQRQMDPRISKGCQTNAAMGVRRRTPQGLRSC